MVFCREEMTNYMEFPLGKLHTTYIARAVREHVQ